MPKVSVIIPAYNQAKYLEDALNSVRNQTFGDWECIIVNDGSTDNTEEITKKYVKRDSRFKYIYQENKGLAGARNAGLKHAEGDFIQFLDSDDLLVSTKLDKQISVLGSDSEVDAVFCDSIEFWGEGYPNSEKTNIRKFGPWEDPLKHFITASTFPIHSFLIKRAVFNQQKFVESFRANEDRFFWSCYCLNGGKFKYIPEALIYRRLRKESMSMNSSNMVPAFVLYYQKIIPLLKSKLPPYKLKKYRIIVLMECLKWYSKADRTGSSKEADALLSMTKVLLKEYLLFRFHDKLKFIGNIYFIFLSILLSFYLRLHHYNIRGNQFILKLFYFILSPCDNIKKHLRKHTNGC
jgi:glycosyltransferase involved in cell wall biosynthesis